jgi:hypothetical protein
LNRNARGRRIGGLVRFVADDWSAPFVLAST